MLKTYKFLGVDRFKRNNWEDCNNHDIEMWTIKVFIIFL